MNKKVLLVDDEEDVQFMMNEMLSLLHFHVDIASSAEEAILKSKNQIYDFYLIDIVLPGISGLEALQHFNINDISKSVIIISANINSTNLDLARSYGIKKFLAKPVKCDHLENLMKDYI